MSVGNFFQTLVYISIALSRMKRPSILLIYKARVRITCLCGMMEESYHDYPFYQSVQYHCYRSYKIIVEIC